MFSIPIFTICSNVDFGSENLNVKILSGLGQRMNKHDYNFKIQTYKKNKFPNKFLSI